MLGRRGEFEGVADWLPVLPLCLYLDCGQVLGEAEQRSAGGVLIPDTEQVVIAAAGQVTSVARPLQAADLLTVSPQRADVMGRHTHVVLVYGPSTTATAHTDTTHHPYRQQEPSCR